MASSFDQRSDRTGPVSWLKDTFTPEAVKQQELLGYAGAEFEFPTCPAIVSGVKALLDRGVLGYTLPNDTYRGSIVRWMAQVRGCTISPEWIVPTHGTIFSLATCLRMATQPGDNILILTPGYHRYQQAAARLGRETVRVPLSNRGGQYRMDWDALEAAMAQPENKLLVLTNPNNPTGNIYRREELERLAAAARRHGVLVFSDEIFADIAFHGAQVFPYAAAADETDLALSCTSLGKTFSLTGVNHANVLIRNPELRERFLRQRNADHYGSIDPFLYAALTAAYSPEGRQWLEELKAYVWQNYELFRDFLRERLPGAVVTEPEGTYVVWADFSGTGLSGEALRRLLCQEGLFVGDEGGDYYGADTCFRYCLAVPRGELKRSLAWLDDALRGKPYPMETNTER